MPSLWTSLFCSPKGVKTPVNGTILVEAVVCPAAFYVIVQVLGHPDLVADLDGLINLAVARVGKRFVGIGTAIGFGTTHAVNAMNNFFTV